MSENAQQEQPGDGDHDVTDHQVTRELDRSATDVPQTGEPSVDSALEGLQDLDAAPLDEHHDRLSRVHEDLHRALNPE